jgi:hypothetical protein
VAFQKLGGAVRASSGRSFAFYNIGSTEQTAEYLWRGFTSWLEDLQVYTATILKNGPSINILVRPVAETFNHKG